MPQSLEHLKQGEAECRDRGRGRGGKGRSLAATDMKVDFLSHSSTIPQVRESKKIREVKKGRRNGKGGKQE
jgi:hypothetical protein